MRSPERGIDHVLMVIGQNFIASSNQAAIDTKSAAYLVILVTSGAITSATATVHLEESDDGSTGWTDIAGATQDISTQNAAQAPGLVRLHGRKRYVRAVVDIDGTAAILAASGLLYDYAYEQDFSNTFSYTV